MSEHIILALEKLGATVDRANFSKNMNNPEFAERVRTSLASHGATVPDSANFYNKYSKPDVKVEADKPKSVGKQIVDGFRAGAKDLYGKAKTIVAAVPAAYVAGTEAAYSKDQPEARGKFDKAYTSTMNKAHTPGNLLYDVTDPMNLASLAAPEIKATGMLSTILKNAFVSGAVGAGTEAGRQALSPDEAQYEMNPTKIMAAAGLAGGLGAAGSSIKGLASKGFKTLEEKGKLYNLAQKELNPSKQMGLSEAAQDLLSGYFKNKAEDIKLVSDKGVKHIAKIVSGLAGAGIGGAHSGTGGALVGMALGANSDLLESGLTNVIQKGTTKLAKGAVTPTAKNIANLAKQLAPIKPVTQGATKLVISALDTDQIKEGAIKTTSGGDRVIYKAGKWIPYNGK